MFIVFLGQTPPVPDAFPIVLPLLEDSLLSALCMNVWPVLGLEDAIDGGVSAFLEGVTVAPNGFPWESGAGLDGGDFEGDDVIPKAAGCGFEPEENFELMLDIHEFRLPGVGIFGSLVPFEELGPGDSFFSEFGRWVRCGLCIWLWD